MKPAMRPTLHRWFGSPSLVALLGAAALLGGCAGTATTQVTITPPDPAPVCAPAASGPVAVFWRTQWRADQKDVTEREAAAAQGIQRFFADGRCFTLATVVRTTEIGSAFDVPAGADRLVVLTVRELGPVVKLLSSAALVDGGTEVVLDVAEYRPGQRAPQRQFSIRWANGGPGVVKGVQTLPADLAAALKAGLGAL